MIRFIFRILKRLLIWGIIIGGGYLYLTNSQVQTTANRDLWNLRNRITQVVNHYLPQLGLQSATASPTASDQSSSGQSGQTTSTTARDSTNTNGRWPSNQATVYVATGNQELDNATNSAIAAWNRTGVFTFKKTTNRQKADIMVSAMDNNSTDAAGLTKSSANSVTKRFVHADVYLNVHYLTDPAYGYSQERIINTAEHELGHAIGLDHTNAVSVMQPAGSFYTIQPRDVQAVQQLYK